MKTVRTGWRPAESESDLAREVQSLRRTLRDVVALSALPSIWVDCDLPRSIQNLTDVLRAALRALTVCIRVKLPDGSEFTTAASDGLSNSSVPHWDAGELLDAIDADARELVEIPRFNGGESLNALPHPLFFGGRPIGCLAACYKSDVLPSQNDSLLLQVAANQIALLFQRHNDQEERLARKLAEERLRQAEYHYQQLVQLLPAAVYTCDNDGRITLYNEAAVKLWGRRPKIGEDMWCGSWKIYKPDGSPLPLNNCPMAIAIREGRSVRGQEIIVERPDGTRLSVLVNIDPIFDSEGKPAGAINVFQDVTPLRRVQEELKSREEHLRAIVENTPECVKLVAEDGTLLGMNGAGLSMVEADCAEQVIGKNIYDVIAPEYRSAFRAMNQRVCAGNKERLEFEIIGLKGTRRWMETHAAPIVDPTSGRTVQIAVTRNITERRNAELELRRKNEQLAAFLETAALGLHRVGPDGIIQWANDAELHMLGYSKEEYIGHDIREFHADEPVINDILKRLTCGEKLNGYEARLRCKDGSIKTVLIDSSVLWEDGKFIHTRCFTRDVTERKSAETALRESEAQLQTELADSKLLQAISVEIVSESHMETLYQKLADAAAALMRSDFASMQMYYPERGSGELRLLALRGFGPEAAKTWEWVTRKSPSSCGEALRRGERVVGTDVERCEFLGSEGLAAYRAAGIGSMQSTPLFSRNGELVGMVSTHWRKPHEPSERELRLFDILARLAADVIERRRAEMLLHESNALLESQKDAFQAAMRGCSLEESLEVLVRRASAFTGGRGRAAFYITSPDGKALHHVVGMHEHYAKCVDGYPVSGESMACGLAVHTGEPVIARDVEQDPKWEAYRWLARHHNFRACWSFPVRTKDGPVLGTLAMYFPEPCEPTARQMELATVIAHAATVIISRHQQSAERERAEQALRKRGERLQLLSETLGQLLSARDPDAIVRELFPKVAAHLGVDTYFNFMVNGDGNSLKLHSCAGIPEKTARGIERLEFGQAICGTVAQTRAPIHATDIQNSDYDKAALVRGFGIQCYACNPLLVGDRLLGTLSFASRTRKEFDADELQFLSMVSQHAAVALERLQFAQQLEKTVEERTASLREAIEQMEEFSYSVSHDLRGPLRARNAYAGVLLEEYGSQLDEIARGYL